MLFVFLGNSNYCLLYKVGGHQLTRTVEDPLSLGGECLVCLTLKCKSNVEYKNYFYNIKMSLKVHLKPILLSPSHCIMNMSVTY